MISNKESNNHNPNTFFKSGGFLPLEAPSYVPRQADNELLSELLQGDYCAVLAPRQSGKTSLMIRTAFQLQENDRRTAVIDLKTLSSGLSLEQWYISILETLQSQLDFVTAVQGWWQQNKDIPPSQRFVKFLRRVLLGEIREHLVIFFDRIEFTQNLSFSDEFYGALADAYHSRLHENAFNRLTCAFMGSATPAMLGQADDSSVFAHCRLIELTDFTMMEAQPLQQALESYLGDQSEQIFARMFQWTNGQPYLTQKLCLAVCQDQTADWDDEKIDALVTTLFLSSSVKEPQLDFIHRCVAASVNKQTMLEVYSKLWYGDAVLVDDESVLQNQLKVIGLLGIDRNEFPRQLMVRNRIYKKVFDRDWVKSLMPVEKNPPVWTQPYLYLVLLLFVIILFGGFIVALDSGGDDSLLDLMPPPDGVTATNQAALTTAVAPEGIEQIESSATAVPTEPTVTNTVVPPTASNSPTPAPSHTPVPPTETPTPSPTPTETLFPTDTPIPLPTEIPTAVANQLARVFFAPDTTTLELARLEAGDVVEVIGRSDGRFGRERDEPGLYIRTEDGTEGFVVAVYFDWPGTISDLEVVLPEAVALFNSNVRAEPDINATRVGVAFQGQIIEVLGASADKQWYYVRIPDGTEGFAEVGRIDWRGGIIDNLPTP